MRRLKVAVVGNSHVTALSKALDVHPEILNEIDPTFYAAPARYAHDIRAIDGRVEPKSDKTKEFYLHTSGKNDFIDVNSYDVIWLYGLTERLDKIYCWHKNVFRSECFSEQCKDLSFIDRYNAGFGIAKSLKSYSKVVFISPRPFPSSEEHIEELCDYNENDMSLAVRFMDDMANEIDVGFIVQPKSTFIKNSSFITNPDYSLGSLALSKHLNQEQPGLESARQDFIHMNSKFGVAMWNEFLNKLASKGK